MKALLSICLCLRLYLRNFKSRLVISRSLEAELSKQAMNKEVQAFEENHIWQIIDSSSNTKVLGGKRVYRIKRGIDGEPS